MAWIESHQSLVTHRKLLRLATKLHADKFKLIGHLHALWWWGLDNAQNDGSLGEAFPEEIAAAAGWDMRKGGEFVAALVFAKFLDEREDGAYVLHNWHRYAGKLNAKKTKDKERKREIAANSDGIPAENATKPQAPNNTNHTTPSEQPTEPTKPDLTTPTVAAAVPNIFSLYEMVFGAGKMNDFIRTELIELEEEHSETCLEKHFKASARVVPRPKSLGYVTSKLSHTRSECDQPETPRIAVGVATPRPKSLLYEDA